MVLLQGKLYFSKDPEGVQHFPEGPNFFHGDGGPNAYFYRNQYNLWFSGADPYPPPPPLYPHMHVVFRKPIN